MKRTTALNAGRRPVIVLIVDDSAVVRQAMKAIVEADSTFQVLTAGDPYEAVVVMRKTAPTVILLDVNMPRMDGLTFLKKLMRQHPMPVLLITDHPERALAGLELGALDVIPKPNWDNASELENWSSRLLEALYAAVEVSPPQRSPVVPEPLACSSPPPRYTADVILPRMPYAPGRSARERIIAIGASTGGIRAITVLLAQLPASMPPIVIVQHLPWNFTGSFADRLNRDPAIALRVQEGSPNEPLRPGCVFIVPGSTHGVVRRHGTGYRLELVDGPPVNRHRPSVDVIFRSVTQAAGPASAGVILTGMLDDGARGLLEMAQDGAWTIAQDQSTCEVFGMPREAIRLGAARQILPLDRIGAALIDWSTGTGDRGGSKLAR